jgi:hypothetical protein
MQRLPTTSFRVERRLLSGVSCLATNKRSIAIWMTPEHTEASCVCLEDAVDDLQQCALSGAIGTDKPYEFARLNR